MRGVGALLTAAVLAFILDSAIALAGTRWTGVPKGFPPFTALPILSGVVGGFLLGGLAFAVLRALFAKPEFPFLVVAMVALAISFVLPLRLSSTKSQRFAGVTPGAQMVLIVMHAVIAASVVAVLTRGGRETP